MFSIHADMLAALHIAAADTNRQYINGVRIEKTPDPATGYGVTLAATNGHILAIAYDRWGTADRDVTITFDHKDKGLKAPFRENGYRRVFWDDGADFCRVIANQPDGPPEEGTVEARLRITEQVGDFPQWRRMLSQAPEKQYSSYAWGQEVLDTAFKVARRFPDAPKAIYLNFEQVTPADPARVTVVDHQPSLMMIAMPARAKNKKEGLPWWIHYHNSRTDAA